MIKEENHNDFYNCAKGDAILGDSDFDREDGVIELKKDLQNLSGKFKKKTPANKVRRSFGEGKVEPVIIQTDQDCKFTKPINNMIAIDFYR